MSSRDLEGLAYTNNTRLPWRQIINNYWELDKKKREGERFGRPSTPVAATQLYTDPGQGYRSVFGRVVVAPDTRVRRDPPKYDELVRIHAEEEVDDSDFD